MSAAGISTVISGFETRNDGFTGHLDWHGSSGDGDRGLSSLFSTSLLIALA